MASDLVAESSVNHEAERNNSGRKILGAKNFSKILFIAVKYNFTETGIQLISPTLMQEA
jgi:hypothetical protein